MTVIVRPADLESDGASMVGLLARHLNPHYDAARFDWLYRDNPAGPPRAWVAIDQSTGGLVGTAAAIPREVYVEGTVRLALVLSDFCLVPEFRVLGPALRLQRACMGPVDAGEVPFCYDFPAHTMMAVYRRLGVKPLTQMRRFAKPLRVDGRVRERVGRPLVAAAVSAVGNLLLGLAARRRKAPRGVDISPHPGTCGEEFSALAREGARNHLVCVRRSAEYLNWRFLACPYQGHEVLTARRGDALVGYAVVTTDPAAATIADLFCVEGDDILPALVIAAVARLRGRGAATVSLPLIETHPWARLLLRLGFTAREASPVVAYAHAGSPEATLALAASSWLLTSGDRDS